MLKKRRSKKAEDAGEAEAKTIPIIISLSPLVDSPSAFPRLALVHFVAHIKKHGSSLQQISVHWRQPLVRSNWQLATTLANRDIWPDHSPCRGLTMTITTRGYCAPPWVYLVILEVVHAHHRIQPPVHVCSLACGALIVCHYGSTIRKGSALAQSRCGEIIGLKGTRHLQLSLTTWGLDQLEPKQRESPHGLIGKRLACQSFQPHAPSSSHQPQSTRLSSSLGYQVSNIFPPLQDIESSLSHIISLSH